MRSCRGASVVSGGFVLLLLMGVGAVSGSVDAQEEAGADADVAATTPTLPPMPDFTSAERGRVLRVVRGDTLIVRYGGRGRRIGLLGTTAGPPTDGAGAEAQRALTNLLKGESVYVVFPAEPPVPDRFGRLPAYVYRVPDGLFVNLELVRQGYLAVTPGEAFAYRAAFEYYEGQARRARKGRWGPPPSWAADEGLCGGQSEPLGGKAVGEEAETRGRKAATGEHVAGAPTGGEGSGKGRADRTDGDPVVYVTANGTRYHREGCYHLRKSRIPLARREARARGYRPCAHCKPDDEAEPATP